VVSLLAMRLLSVGDTEGSEGEKPVR